VIFNYREIEKSRWNEANHNAVLKVRSLLPSNINWLAVHVLDLAEDGSIAPHVDSVKFSGGIVAGLCLLSPSVMILSPDGEVVCPVEKQQRVKILLEPRTLYFLSKDARYKWKHEIPAGVVDFRGQPITKTRRISLMFRDELSAEGGTGAV